MYVPTLPFSQNGITPKDLTYDLTRINVNGVKITQQPITCTGYSGCLTQVFNGNVMATSALDMTHAICTGNVTSETGTTRYTGICQRELVQHEYDLADSFLTECKSNRNDFILVTYTKDSTNFTAYGNARALISETFVDTGDLYKTSQSVNRSNADIAAFCPTYATIP